MGGKTFQMRQRRGFDIRSAKAAGARRERQIQHRPRYEARSSLRLRRPLSLTREAVMLWSINIGRIAGTAIRIHVTFVLFLVWIWGASYVSGGAAAAWSGLVFMLLLFLCVLLHEFGHIFTARAFGVQTPDVTLLPIGGVARLERIPEEPGQEFLLAIAGPLVNVAIALALIVFAGADLSTQRLAAVENAQVSMVDRLAAVNLFIAVFNLIPAFPMDGGRILRSLLALRLGFARATEISATIGQWVAFALGFIGLFSNAMLIFIAIFVYLAASSEAHLVAVRTMSRGVPLTSAMMTQYAVLAPEAHIDEAIDTLLRTSQTEFPVIDGAGKLIGLLGRSDMIRALKTLGPDARVADAMIADVPVLDRRRTLDEAFALLQQKAARAVGVTGPDGRLVGLVTPETIGEMLMVREALPAGVKAGPWGRAAGA
jgi:stage IV sporulation protein FB